MKKLIPLLILLLTACTKDNPSSVKTGVINPGGIYNQLGLGGNNALQTIGCLKQYGELELDLNDDGTSDLTFELLEELPDLDSICCQSSTATCIPSVNMSVVVQSNNPNIQIAVDENALPLKIPDFTILTSLNYQAIETGLIMGALNGNINNLSSSGNWINDSTEPSYIAIRFKDNDEIKYAWIKVGSRLDFDFMYFILVDYYLQ